MTQNCDDVHKRFNFATSLVFWIPEDIVLHRYTVARAGGERLVGLESTDSGSIAVTTFALEECTVDHVVKALNQRKNAGPATLKQIKSALPKPLRSCENALAEAVRQRRVWHYGNKGPDEIFWTQAATDYAFSITEQTLRSSPGGFSEKRLVKKIEAPFLIGLVDGREFLASLVAQSRIFALPRKGKAELKYVLEPVHVEAPEDIAWKIIETKLTESPGGVKEAELTKLLRIGSLKGALDVPNYLSSLVANGRIFVQPSGPKKSPIKYSLDQFSFVDALVDEFVANARHLSAENNLNPAIAIERARHRFESLIETTGLDVTQKSDQSATSDYPQVQPVNSGSSAQTTQKTDSATAELILQAIREVNPRADDGDIVLIHELRQRLDFHQIEKSRFDRLLLELYVARKVILSKTSVGLVSDSDRHDFVVDGEGNFYNTVAYWKAS